MPFNGNGTFSRLMTWVNDAASGIKIRADRHDQNDDDVAAGLSMALLKDGQATPVNNIPWGGKKIINLGDPTADQDAVTKKYVDLLTNFSVQLQIKGSGQLGHIIWTGNEIASPASGWGPLGLQFNQADMFFGVKVADSTAGARWTFNDKADGTGTEQAYITDLGTMKLKGASAQYMLQPSSGNGHLWFYGTDGTTRAIIYTAAGTQGPLYFTVGSVGFYMHSNGNMMVPGVVYTGSGSAYLSNDGNIFGPVWTNLGYGDAYTAIVNRIESRAIAWANDRVANLQFRKVSLGYNGQTGGFSNLGAGTVICGYSREGGNTGQVAGLYYVTLQAWDPVRGWVSFQG